MELLMLILRKPLWILLAVFFLAAVPAGAESDPDQSLQRILVPIFFLPDLPEQGRFGTRWATELWIRNSGTEPRRVWQGDGRCNHGGCVDDSIPSMSTVRPIDVYPSPVRETPGVLLHAQRAGAESIHFALWLRELTSGQWTALPVVREHEFLRTRAEFPLVPVHQGKRIAVRVYDPRPVPGGLPVTIGVHQPQGGQLGSVRVTAWTYYTPFEPDLFQRVPGYAAVLSLGDTFPAISGEAAVRISVVPDDPDRDFWVFVTLTDNESQHVDTVLPE